MIKKITLILFLCLIISCNKEFLIIESDSVELIMNFDPVEYDFSIDNQTEKIFTDKEDIDYMSKNRRFKINQLLEFKSIGNKGIKITNFLPSDLKNIDVEIKIEGIENPIKLMKIIKIEGHTSIYIDYPFIKKQYFYYDNKGNKIDLSSFSKQGISAEKISITYSSESDDLVKKIKKLENLNWNMKFFGFDPQATHPNWLDNNKFTAKLARIYTAYITNIAYIYSFDQEFFYQEMKKEELRNNKDEKISDVDKLALIEKISKMNFNLGIVTTVSGLGGGDTFGVAQDVLKKGINGEESTVAHHEIGHKLGYNHSSNMTYSTDKGGFTKVLERLRQKIISEGGFPLNLENYYKKEDLKD